MNGRAAERDLNSLYREQFKEHGVDVRSLLWPTRERQRAGFRAMVSNVGMALTNATILDVGCGFGDLPVYLLENGYYVHRYVGIDPIQEFIEVARQRCSGMDWADFEVASLETYGNSHARYNYVVALGLLSTTHRWEWGNMLARMWAMATDGIVFTCLTEHVYKGALRSYEPGDVLHLVQHVSALWKSDASYGEEECCVTVHKEPVGSE